MSHAIRSYIRNVILESMLQESLPPTPLDIRLDEAPPRTPDPEPDPSVIAPAPLGGRVPASDAPPAVVDPALASYLRDAIDFLNKNDIAIGAAADYVVDDITGFTSPDEIMAIYEKAAQIDIKHMQHDVNGGAKNWTVLLLGCALSGILGQSALNYIPEILITAEKLIIRAHEAASDAGSLEEQIAAVRRQLLREGSIGKIIMQALKTDIGGWDGAFAKALDAEALEAAKLLDDVGELDRVLAGGTTHKFGDLTLPDYVQAQTVSSIRSTRLSDIGQNWSRAADRALKAAGMRTGTVDDLLDPPPGFMTTADLDVATDTLERQLRAIAFKPDSDILAAAKRGDSFFKAGAARSAIKTKVKTPGAGGAAAAGGVLGAAGSFLSGLTSLQGIMTAAGLATPIGVLIVANWADSEMNTRLNPDLLTAFNRIRNADVSLDEKITGMDFTLAIMWDKTGGFSHTRERINNACGEYWGDPTAACTNFQQILQQGPYGIGAE